MKTMAFADDVIVQKSKMEEVQTSGCMARSDTQIWDEIQCKEVWVHVDNMGQGYTSRKAAEEWKRTEESTVIQVRYLISELEENGKNEKNLNERASKWEMFIE